MHRSKKTCMAVVLCAAVLSQSFAFDTYGASAADSSLSKSAAAASMFTLDQLGSVTLKQSVSVKLTDMNIFAQPDGSILTYTLRYSNNSGSRVDLIDYFSKVSTPSGAIVKGKVVTRDAGKRSVPANSSHSVTYYVNIGRSAQVNGMKVSIFGWDFSSATYEKKLGGFTIPAQYSSVVPVGKSKKMNNLSVTAKADTVQRYTINGKVYIKLGMKLSNGGTKVLSDPGYKAYLKSAGGSVFELLPESSSTGYKLQPQESTTIYYWAEIPSAMKTNAMTLQLAEEDEALKIHLPVQSFKLPAAGSDIAVAKGKSGKLMMQQQPVTVRAERMQRMKHNGKVYLRVGVNVANGGKKVLSDPGYKVQLKSAGGSVFDLVPEDETGGSFKIQPGQKRTIYYMAEVPSKLKTDNMTMQFMQEDEALKMTLPVKTFKLPSVTADVPAADYAVKKISVNHLMIETQLKSASVYAENDTGKWSLQFRVKNLGEKSLKLPAYEFSILTNEGYSIPVNAKALANVTLKPLEEKLIDLRADVPLHMKQNMLQLQLTEPAVEGKISFPAAHYKIPYAQEGKSHLGSENIIENDHGTFGVKLSSYQRLPWGDGDQIAARISIRNTKALTVQLPGLKAEVKADMRDLSSTAQIVIPNDQTTLASNETVEMYVLANVPYSYNFNQLRIELQEISSGEADVTRFLSLNTRAVNNVVNQVAAGESYRIDTPGKKAEVRERMSTVYPDSSSNLIYTELEMTSQETRQSKQAQLVAYYKTPDNEYFEAEVNQSSVKTGLNGKNLVTVWSKLPLNVNTSQLVLYIGEGVAGEKLTDQREESTEVIGSINTVGLALSPRAFQPATNLGNVELFPYKLSITRGEARLSEGKDTLNTAIDYNLSRNGDYETGEYEHKLIMEMIDPTGQSTEKTLTLGTDLSIGSNKSYTMTMNTNFHKNVSGGGVRIILYDEFQGRRMLLGSQSYPIIYEENQANRPDSD
ncbi:hypothetical protein C7121_20710 [Paenibacillus glucanolyticus]|jgi:hypothetical protein|uniref:hypothetical protein n=1 Tax=Paenibacillus TaxID=44249 RepID=UPI0003E26FF3|nr:MULTISPECIES: hypothetical protein [Paenibacillus]AVV58377.1 hypothetical protein C7121_20710 [Paenibacillus glucanolyticus]ETT42594.1 hypothetical protein C169_04912 [Paenibacillus sp. FSL R5-808]MCA4752241.1 hypothetical protein [Mycolicibacterium fortuitum]